MKSGIEIIAEERQRQISVENWSLNHDVMHHTRGELAQAAACYAMPQAERKQYQSYSKFGWFPRWWPKDWSVRWWKPSPDNRIKELAKAGALIAAEIDRLQEIDRRMAECRRKEGGML